MLVGDRVAGNAHHAETQIQAKKKARPWKGAPFLVAAVQGVIRR